MAIIENIKPKTGAVASVSVKELGRTEELLISFDNVLGLARFNTPNDGLVRKYVVNIKSETGEKVQQIFSLTCGIKPPEPKPPIVPPVPVTPSGTICRYALFRGGSTGGTFNYEGCDGQRHTQTILANEKVTVCVKEGYFNVDSMYVFFVSYSGECGSPPSPTAPPTPTPTPTPTEPPSPIVPPPVPEPPATVPCGIEERNSHDNAAAIPKGTHHGFYDLSTNQVVGTFASGYGQFNAYGQWKNSVFAGMGSDGLRYTFYREPYSYPVNVRTRTREGCTEFNDLRTTEVNPHSFDYKHTVNTNQDHAGNTIDFDALMLASNLGYPINDRSEWTRKQFVYEFYLINAPAGLNYQVNSNGVRGGQVNGSRTKIMNDGFDFNEGGGGLEKDYILTLYRGGDRDKFVVRNWTTGGHFGTVTTITRLRDGKVWVYTFIGVPEINQHLLVNGNVIPGHNEIGNSFVLPSLSSDVTADFYFSDPNVKFLSIKLQSKDN